MSIADNATTLMYNIQARAASGNATLRVIIATLEGMLGKMYKLYSPDFNADIPQVDITDIPDLISDVEGYMQQVLADAGAIDGLISNGSASAIAKLEELLASLMPADPNLTLPDTSVSFSDGAMAAERALSDAERRQAEVAILAEYATRKFFTAPGEAVGAIADLRIKAAAELGERAAAVRMKEAEQNAKLYIERVSKQFQMESELLRNWTNVFDLTVKLIGQIIAEYEKSPLLDAEIAASTAAALTSAYGGLNQSAVQLTHAAGVSYKAALAPYKLQLLEDQLKTMAYAKGMKLTFAARTKIASALASALRDAGQVAHACIAAISAHGNYTERAFS